MRVLAVADDVADRRRRGARTPRRGWPTTAAVTGRVPASAAPGPGAGRARVDRPRPAGRGGQPGPGRGRGRRRRRAARSGRPGHPDRRGASAGRRGRPVPGPGGCGPWAAGSSTWSPPRSPRSSRDDCWPPRRPAPPGPRSCAAAGSVAGSASSSSRPRRRLRQAVHLPRGLHQPRRPEPGAAGSAAGIEDPQGPREDRRPYDQRLGAAFVSFLEAVDPQRLPLHGGDATTVLVTVQLDQLLADLRGGHHRRRAHLLLGRPAAWRAPPGSSRSCSTATGRPRRRPHLPPPFTPAQRRSSRSPSPPAGPTVATSPPPGAGPPRRQTLGRRHCTDLADGLLLCPFHHHRAHDARYDTLTPARRARPVRPADVRRSSGSSQVSLDGSRSGTPSEQRRGSGLCTQLLRSAPGRVVLLRVRWRARSAARPVPPSAHASAATCAVVAMGGAADPSAVVRPRPGWILSEPPGRPKRQSDQPETKKPRGSQDEARRHCGRCSPRRLRHR